MNRLRFPMALAVAGLLAPAVAQPADPWPGFTVRPPAGFAVAPASHPQNDKVLAIRSWTGFPAAANRDGTLCSAAFKGAAQNGTLTQADINAKIAADAWRATARGTIANVFNIRSETVYTDDGVSGVEFVATPKTGPDAANVRIILAIAETPKGRSTLSCAVAARDLEAALPQLSAIRSTIQIPR